MFEKPFWAKFRILFYLYTRKYEKNLGMYVQKHHVYKNIFNQNFDENNFYIIKKFWG